MHKQAAAIQIKDIKHPIFSSTRAGRSRFRVASDDGGRSPHSRGRFLSHLIHQLPHQSKSTRIVGLRNSCIQQLIALRSRKTLARQMRSLLIGGRKIEAATPSFYLTMGRRSRSRRPRSFATPKSQSTMTSRPRREAISIPLSIAIRSIGVLSIRRRRPVELPASAKVYRRLRPDYSAIKIRPASPLASKANPSLISSSSIR